jgi:two-component sensor histidine kinase
MLSPVAETALRQRRPAGLRAITLALIHKHLYEDMRQASRRLETLIREIRTSPPAV